MDKNTVSVVAMIALACIGIMLVVYAIAVQDISGVSALIKTIVGLIAAALGVPKTVEGVMWFRARRKTSVGS